MTVHRGDWVVCLRCGHDDRGPLGRDGLCDRCRRGHHLRVEHVAALRAESPGMGEPTAIRMLTPEGEGQS